MENVPPIVHCPTHTRVVFDVTQFPLIVRWAEEKLLELRADAIVACGHSGLPLAGALMMAARIPVFAVRKAGEQTVACTSPAVSGIAPRGKAQRWVWVDDFMSSGGTFVRCARLVWEAELVETVYPVAALHYRDYQEPSREISGSVLDALADVAPTGTIPRIPLCGFLK